ncbi:MAG: imidazole glycerol phosphate synthase subunit HisH [Gammaproteobacteria bacterium]|nr:imidazole glycerol phosphate synthase subunit HisH [Gammaproteobacteria bacterium]
MSEVVVIDSGGANLASLKFALGRIGARARFTTDAQDIRNAERVLLPGVGAAGATMQRLQNLGLVPVIKSLNCPLLGICLGMQILFEHSEEGDTPCLGILPGKIKRLHPTIGLPVPHMGWNTLEQSGADPLLEGFPSSAYFYFVHSYAAEKNANTIAISKYGGPLTAVVRRANFYGVQFHPERSSAAGSKVLDNFLKLK